MAEGSCTQFSVMARGAPRSRARTSLFLARTQRKEVALEAGRAEAQRRKTEHVIHNEDGPIGERNSYGNDPSDCPG